MGYGRDDAVYALRVTENSLEHACNYLFSNPNPSASIGSRIGASMESLVEQRSQLLDERIRI
jgi:hypothetical protein